MANEINISAVTGLTPSIQLYNGSTPVGSPFAATELLATGEYFSDMPIGIPYGHYMVLATVGSDVKIGSGEIFWSGSEELIESLSMLEGLDPDSPMEVTPSSRTTGDINLGITGDGETQTIVTRL